MRSLWWFNLLKTVTKRGLKSEIYLTYYDKDILVSGEKLSDKHINLAQRILKGKFSKINRLHLTLLRDKPHKESTNNAFQIFHTCGDHWLCATTIGISG